MEASIKLITTRDKQKLRLSSFFLHPGIVILRKTKREMGEISNHGTSVRSSPSPNAVQKEQSVFLGVPGQPVPDDPGEVGLQFGVIVGDPGQKFIP